MPMMQIVRDYQVLCTGFGTVVCRRATNVLLSCFPKLESPVLRGREVGFIWPLSVDRSKKSSKTTEWNNEEGFGVTLINEYCPYLLPVILVSIWDDLLVFFQSICSLSMSCNETILHEDGTRQDLCTGSRHHQLGSVQT